MSCRCGDSNCNCSERCLCSSEFCLCINCFDLKKAAAVKLEVKEELLEYSPSTSRSSLKSEVIDSDKCSNTDKKCSEIVNSSCEETGSDVVFVGSGSIKQEADNNKISLFSETTLSDSDCEIITEKREISNVSKCSLKVEDDSFKEENDTLEVVEDFFKGDDDSFKMESNNSKVEVDNTLNSEENTLNVGGNTLNVGGNTLNVANNYFILESGYVNLQNSYYRRNNFRYFPNNYNYKRFRRRHNNRRSDQNSYKDLRININNSQPQKRNVFMSQCVNANVSGNRETQGIETSVNENSDFDTNVRQEAVRVNEYNDERNESIKNAALNGLYQTNPSRYSSEHEAGSSSQNEASSLVKRRKITRSSFKLAQNEIFSENASVSTFVEKSSSSFGQQIDLISSNKSEIQNTNDDAVKIPTSSGNNTPDLSVYDFDENESNSSGQTRLSSDPRNIFQKKDSLDKSEINTTLKRRNNSVTFSEIYSVHNIGGDESRYEINDRGINHRVRRKKIPKRRYKTIKRVLETHEVNPKYELNTKRRPRRKGRWLKRNVPCKKEKSAIDVKIKKEKIDVKKKKEKVFIKNESTFIKKEIKREIP